MKASPESPLAERLARIIAAEGSICVAHYMAEANAHYYGSRDPFGRNGDFVTAPEISQIFGELSGLCLADLWQRAGRPAARYVELGPGRGTLAADALRAMAAAGFDPPVELVETSPVLRAAQASRVPHARWHADIASLPETGSLMIVANEFFDALPIRQFVAADDGWRERVVIREEGGFAPALGALIDGAVVPPHLRGAPPGAVFEISPVGLAVVRELGRRLAAQGGAMLVFDYGHMRSSAGDTLQAVARHAFADPWRRPGEHDLTAHVDFQALGAAAAESGAIVCGPKPQGEWLKAMGIQERAAVLRQGHPARAAEIDETVNRLTADDRMGSLFKVMALVAPGWPQPAGFA